MSQEDTNYLNSIKTRIRDFESQYATISRSVEMFGRYNTWLHFECNGLVIDTASPKNTNIILQTWEYDKNGSGYANNFTLRICYNFMESADLYKKETIHYVENALCLNKVMNTSDTTKAMVKTVNKMKCKFRYGYINVGVNSSQVLSPWYEGQVLHCKPELRDNMLFYEITGVSTAYGGSNVAKLNFPEVKGWKATDLAWDTLNKYYGAGRKDNEYKDAVPEDYQIVNKTDADGLRSKEKEQDFKAVNGVTVFDYVQNYVLKNVPLEGYFKDNEESKMKIKEIQKSGNSPYYALIIDDSKEANGKKSIVIDLVDPTGTIKQTYYEAGEQDQLADNGNNYDTNIVFRYPTKDQDFIQSFTPDVDLKLIWTQTVFSDSDAKRWGLDEGGNLVSTSEVGENGFTTFTRTDGEVGSATTNQTQTDSSGESGTATDNAKKDDEVQTTENNRTAASFAEASDLNYSASLSCLGIPADIPILTRIKISPILNGCEYMFGGIYIIRGCKDRIDSSGYITEMDLFRLKNQKE